MNNLAGSIVSFSLFAGFLLLFFLMSLLLYRHNKKRSFSFKNEFPYELIDQKKIKISLLVLFSLAGIGAFSFVFNALDFRILHSFLIVIFFAFAFSMFLVLFFYPASKPKVHTVFFYLANGFMIFVGIAMSLYFSEHFAHVEINGSLVKKIFAFGVPLVLIVYFLLIIINPKLRNWPKLEEVVNKDGSINYVRPRVFVLALSEWLTLAGIVFFVVSLFVFRLTILK